MQQSYFCYRFIVVDSIQFLQKDCNKQANEFLIACIHSISCIFNIHRVTENDTHQSVETSSRTSDFLQSRRRYWTWQNLTSNWTRITFLHSSYFSLERQVGKQSMTHARNHTFCKSEPKPDSLLAKNHGKWSPIFGRCVYTDWVLNGFGFLGIFYAYKTCAIPNEVESVFCMEDDSKLLAIWLLLLALTLSAFLLWLIALIWRRIYSKSLRLNAGDRFGKLLSLVGFA